MSGIKSEFENVSCEVCGKNGGECFEVYLGKQKHIFDTFDCAMHALSPHCGYCGCQIQGDSVVLGQTIYCSYQCANDDSAREYEKRVPLREQSNR